MSRMANLIPDEIVDDLFHIPLAALKERGIDVLFFDLDNTIVEWNDMEVGEEIVDWFQELKEQGFQAMILSNNSEQRIAPVASRLKIPFMARAGKPRPRGALRAAASLNAEPSRCAMIGDQIMTDIRAGNRAGFYTIMATPISKREFIGTKINRQIEKLIFRRLNRQHKYRK